MDNFYIWNLKSMFLALGVLNIMTETIDNKINKQVQFTGQGTDNHDFRQTMTPGIPTRHEILYFV